MWHLKLIFASMLLVIHGHGAVAAEYFYSDAVHPSVGQISFAAASAGGHSSRAASLCGPAEENWCYRTSEFHFAIPRTTTMPSQWRQDGYTYELRRRQRLTLFGVVHEVLEIEQFQDSRRIMSFVYSVRKGLLTFQAEGSVRTYLLENRCGLGAPRTCK